jgi:hypothetical protein
LKFIVKSSSRRDEAEKYEDYFYGAVCLNKKLNLILFANGMNVCCFNFLFVEFVVEMFSKLFLKIKIKVGHRT